ncbi:MAG: hypothetical protein FWF51_13120 [Chitinivibrionia bacterium]|nr:hypothetical protein [Chitinivibrionia bacterium]
MIKEKNIRVKDVERFVYQTFGELTENISNPKRIGIEDAFGMFPDMSADFEREEDREI